MADSSNVLPKPAGATQGTIDAASEIADTVSVPETKYRCELTQRAGRQFAGQPCGNVSADRVALTAAKCPRIDPIVCRHGRLNLTRINCRKPASRRYFVVVPGQPNSSPDLIDKIQAP